MYEQSTEALLAVAQFTSFTIFLYDGFITVSLPARILTDIGTESNRFAA